MSGKILVVEDEPAIADTIAYALATEGFEVMRCATGREALEINGRGGIELIVLDVGLPDGNGFELCKEIRRGSATPVIFLTARASEVDRVVGLEIGGDDYVVKPFSPRELAARVKAVLRRQRKSGPEEQGAAAAEKIQVEKVKEDEGRALFQLDRQRMRFNYCGKPLELSRCEFKILEALVSRPGWVFTRQQLMAHMSEEPAPSLERTIDTHIKTLRNKLKEIAPQAEPIQTHRGFGYSLKETP